MSLGPPTLRNTTVVESVDNNPRRGASMRITIVRNNTVLD